MQDALVGRAEVAGPQKGERYLQSFLVRFLIRLLIRL